MRRHPVLPSAGGEVSARGKLWDEVVYALKVSGALRREEISVEANKLIDAFAHELAEKQRAFAEQEDAHLRSTSATIYVQGIRDAADLIDPTKEGDRGQQ
jgi:hypothetical protein